MPVPSLITDLSTTAGSNSPSGSDNVFPDLDNYLRALSAFMASIRDNSGNGWTSPYLPLTYSAGTANGVVYLNGSKVVTTGSGLVFDGTNFSTTGTATATKLIPTGGSATGNGMYLPAANTLAWSNNGAETMRLNSSGNLGLGVTPSAWNIGKAVQVGFAGNALFGATATQFTLTQNATFNTNYLYSTTNPATAYRQNGGEHQWLTAPSGTAGAAITFTQAMTLGASGNLLVGKTVDDQTTVGARIESVGAITLVRNAVTNCIQINKKGNAGDLMAFYYNDAAVVGTITNSSTNTAYNTSSDRRLKENIQPADDAGSVIDAIEVVKHDWKVGGHTRYGMIAQDLHAVAPEAVSAGDDGDEIERTWGVDYSKLVPMLIKEIQSLRARVAALEAA